MSSSTAQEYLDLFGDDPLARLALLACSAALRLDDETAHGAVELVARGNGSTAGLVRRVKGLGCVWKEWDGTWHIANDVRPHLLDRLHEAVSPATLSGLRERLAANADERAERLPPDGQVTSHDKLLSKFEAAYQRMHIPEKLEEGAVQLGELWRQSQQTVPEAAQATARAVDYLADELNRRLPRLPDEVIFLRGMAARSRGDKEAQEKYFRQVWERGRRGYIYAVAAHFFGLLIQRRDRKTAERALRNSIEWNVSPYQRGQVYHTLGNLLAKDPKRWDEAEKAYQQSLSLREDSEDKAQIYHSLGNLLAKDPKRWDEAEKAYRGSIEIDKDDRSRAETLHSFGKLLFDIPERRKEADAVLEHSFRLRDTPSDKAQVLATRADALAKLNDSESASRAEEYALRGIELDPNNPWTAGICYRVLMNVYERQEDYHKAISAAEGLIRTDKQLRGFSFVRITESKIAEFKRKLKQSGVKRSRKSKRKWWDE